MTPADPAPARGRHQLFSYGTLRQREVQRVVFGGELPGAPDALSGYRLDEIAITDPGVVAASGLAVHTIMVPDPAAPDIDGVRLTLDDAQLAAADAYEVADYTRVRVTLRSGLYGWVYVARPDPVGRLDSAPLEVPDEGVER